MEEEKAAAYYDELTRKGANAARFKQGLGFSNHNDAKGSALPSSSFLSSFVKASSPSKSTDAQKQSQIESIQNKLKKKRYSDDRSRGRDSDSRSSSRRRSRSRSRDDDDVDRSRNRNHRSSSRDRDRDRYRDRDRDRDRGRRKRSRSVSPRGRRSEKIRDDDRRSRKGKSIQGYDMMTPAERVKAKMKLQLSATAKQDEANGMGSGWERFNFDKDAPLDDEVIEAAEDDGALVKHIGQTFRFSTVEARREEKIKATHDEAIFGTSSLAPPVDTDSEANGNNCTKENSETAPAAGLISDQVRSLQKGSWRDRIHKA